MWCDTEVEEKIKLRYYKDVINPHLENQNYLFVLPSVKKKISITKIRTNSHELHSEIGHWPILKTPWDERVCHLCDTKKLKMKSTFSSIVQPIPILDLIFKILITLPTFLTS